MHICSACIDDDDDNMETDERAAAERRSKRETNSKRIYEVLKKSYYPQVHTVISDKDLAQTFNKHSTIEKMKAILTGIKGLGQKQMYLYCELGGTFKLLKKKYKVSNKKLDALLRENNYHGYGKSMRNFYISLHDCALDYNKVMYIDISRLGITKIIAYWKDLKKFIVNDADFWKGTYAKPSN